MKGICAIIVVSFFGLIYAQTGCFDEEGCTFRGNRYDEGKNLTFSCFNVVCRKSVWHFTGIDHQNCDSCHLKDDPHIWSFDQHHLYHWYGLCNYSLSQSAYCDVEPSYEPRFAVYADFVHCNTIASCVDSTTYKIDPNTVVTIEHKSSIPHSLIKACYNGLFIYANKKYKGSLVGLCGYYSGDAGDDFVPRGDCFNPAAYVDFAISWLTNVHKKDCDIDNEINLNLKVSLKFVIAKDVEDSCNKEKFYVICEEQIKGGYSLCEKYKISGYHELLKGDIGSTNPNEISILLY
ncbi:Mucin-19 [Armadillidium nasatum]|uniref:Mucin-19 n=1 Tax=Armadillidium nasatum TaxID=96803 RepID=A0A5N5T0J6_9CRUS|nr:Mucin-19 [Armadillidium nasatum]